MVACRRRLSIHSIRTLYANGDHTMVSGRGEVSRILCEQWAPIFDKTNIFRGVGDAFLRHWGRRVEVQSVAPPTIDLYMQVIARARRSALGPDGRPVSAWQASPRWSATIIAFFDDEVRKGNSLPA